jgi:hypothetical protein
VVGCNARSGAAQARFSEPAPQAAIEKPFTGLLNFVDCEYFAEAETAYLQAAWD